MGHASRVVCITILAFFIIVTACRQENPVEKADKPTDKAAEGIERAIVMPIEKAKAVEGVVQGAADRTAEQSPKGE